MMGAHPNSWGQDQLPPACGRPWPMPKLCELEMSRVYDAVNSPRHPLRYSGHNPGFSCVLELVGHVVSGYRERTMNQWGR